MNSILSITFLSAVFCFYGVLHAQSDCIDFTQYDNNFLDDVTFDHSTYPVGDAFISEGDLSIIKPDSNSVYQFIDGANNGMCYIGQLGIDVSSANYACKKLSYKLVGGFGLVIDQDTLNNSWTAIPGDTIIYRPNYMVDIQDLSGELMYTIEGDFNYVEISTSTTCISEMCLTSCSTIPSCVDFSPYNDFNFLNEVSTNHTDYPYDSAFITTGDIQLIKPSSGMTMYQFIDSTGSEMCYIGNLGIDVASAPYQCKELTYGLVGGPGLVIDGDTLTSPFSSFITSDTVMNRPGFSVDVQVLTGQLWYTITGDFDYVEISNSTTCINNICLSSCSDSTSCMDFAPYSNVYLNDVSTDHSTYPAGTVIMSSGDIDIIKTDEMTSPLFIDSANTQFCYVGTIGIDISSTSYDCKVLTYEFFGTNGLIIDSDTILPYSQSTPFDTTIVTSDYTVDIVDNNGIFLYTIEGDFDFVQTFNSTSCIENICVNACDNTMNIVKDEPANLDFELYPNPASSLIHLSSTTDHAATIFIYDMQGKVIDQVKKEGYLSGIDISLLEPGMYLLELRQEDGRRAVKRFVKE